MTQVAFLHIPKCGGSTIRHMLNAVYPYGEQYPAPHDYQSKKAPYRTQSYDIHQVMKWLDSADVSEFNLFMGHYDWQLVQRLDKDVVVLTMLRDPIQQLYSMFRYFWVDTKTYGHFKDRYQGSGFEAFLSEAHVQEFTNVQTRFLSGRRYGTDVSLSNGVLSYAKRNLKKSVYGIMERWDESIDLFENAIGQKLPRNIFENRNGIRLAEPLSDSVIDCVSQLQSYDIGLYEYAVSHFGEQF